MESLQGIPNFNGRPVQVQTGDTFCSASPWIIGRWIVAVSAWWLSADAHAVYGHSGIITSNDGDTIEALWRVRSRNIYEAFSGQQIVIARPLKDLEGFYVTAIDKSEAVKQIIMDHHKTLYPWWRIPLNLIPPLARKFATKKYVVCSEMTAKFAWLIGVRHNQYPGTTPDQLSDEFHRWKQQYEIIYEGKG